MPVISPPSSSHLPSPGKIKIPPKIAPREGKLSPIPLYPIPEPFHHYCLTKLIPTDIEFNLPNLLNQPHIKSGSALEPKRFNPELARDCYDASRRVQEKLNFVAVARSKGFHQGADGIANIWVGEMGCKKAESIFEALPDM